MGRDLCEITLKPVYKCAKYHRLTELPRDVPAPGVECAVRREERRVLRPGTDAAADSPLHGHGNQARAEVKHVVGIT